MDTRRLAAFIKVVDVGSVTRAANLLNVAQPALSQQIASLEAEFGRRLLIRSTRGVTVTAAGQVLYRHAQAIIRQAEEARRCVLRSEPAIAGHVSVGLAPFSTAATLAVPLLRLARERCPGVVLHIRDYFGTVLSELLMNGSLHMAVLYGRGPILGLSFSPVAEEEWFVVGSSDALEGCQDPVSIDVLATSDVLLPTRTTSLRSGVEAACRSAGFTPQIVAELESTNALAGALAEGLGLSVLPWAIASDMARTHRIAIRRMAPGLSMPLSLVVPDGAAMTPAVAAVREVLEEALDHLTTNWPTPERR